MKSDTKIKSEERLPSMPEDLRERFVDLLSVQSYSSMEHMMHYYITRYLDGMDFSWMYDDNGNILVEKGEAKYFPCIVAHMDTVHNIISELVPWYYDDPNDQHIMYFGRAGTDSDDADAGIGGDDKCGIFSVFYMLEKFDNIKAVFFTQEETGCNGSRDIDLGWFDDVGYIIQLDRWGRSDFIDKDTTTDFVSKSFRKASEPIKKKYGYKSTSGLVTDSVKLFNRNVGKSCINLSCGYYQHHTDTELIDANQLYNALLFTEELIETLGEKEYVATPKTKKTKYEDWESWGNGSSASKPLSSRSEKKTAWYSSDDNMCPVCNYYILYTQEEIKNGMCYWCSREKERMSQIEKQHTKEPDKQTDTLSLFDDALDCSLLESNMLWEETYDEASGETKYGPIDKEKMGELLVLYGLSENISCASWQAIDDLQKYDIISEYESITETSVIDVEEFSNRNYG